MTRLQRLESRKAALVAEVSAISQAAEADGQRGLNAEEKPRADAAFSEIASTDIQIAHERQIEEFQRSLPSSPSANQVAEVRAQAPAVAETRAVTIPATCLRSRRLTAFRGERADERAYLSGQWIRAVVGRDQRAAQWCADHGVELRAQSEGSDNLGGVLVPLEMERAIIDLREEFGVFRANSMLSPMASDTKTVPRRATGLTAYFVGEGSEITASDKGWNQVQLTAKKLAALVKYSSELAEDAVINIGDDLAREIAYAFANKEDECGFNGDGTSTYGHIVGVKNALLAGSEYTAITGNTAFGTLDLEDFEGMIGKLPRFPGIQPKWYIHQAGWASSMLRLAAAAGGNTVREIEGGAMPMFLGYPVQMVNVMNSTTTAQVSTEGLVYFGDLAMAAMFGSRRGVSIAVDSSRYFELDQLAIRGTERFDIIVHGTGTASVAGPMIQLITPGS
jgi:HK97 family phage major capsid protein